jgi:SPX domain protein involved in polyphosphate accumulation
MTVSEFKTWLNNIPEEMLNNPIVIRTLKDTEEEGKFAQKDEPVVSALMDTNLNRLCLFDIDSQKVVEKIRKSAPKPEETKPETEE